MSTAQRKRYHVPSVSDVEEGLTAASRSPRFKAAAANGSLTGAPPNPTD